MAPIQRTREIINKLPEHKRHLDFLSALLTIPVLVTVIMINLSNLQTKKAANTPTPTPTATVQGTSTNYQPAARAKFTTVETSAAPTPSIDQAACTKGIGTISIDFPQENQTVSNNPLCIDINYDAGNYCAVVWAYKLNNADFSNYSNNSVCLYNLPSGNNTFTLQVKSLVDASTKTIQRNFIYKNLSDPSVTPTSVATSSANTK